MAPTERFSGFICSHFDFRSSVFATLLCATACGLSACSTVSDNPGVSQPLVKNIPSDPICYELSSLQKVVIPSETRPYIDTITIESPSGVPVERQVRREEIIKQAQVFYLYADPETGLQREVPICGDQSVVGPNSNLDQRAFSWDMVSTGTAPPTFIPPPTKLNFIIPNDEIIAKHGSDPSLWQVFKLIEAEIENENDPDYTSRIFSYDAEGQDSDGFVVITTPERIDEKAVSIKEDGKRIPLDKSTSHRSGLFGHLNLFRFFKNEERRYRYIAFIVKGTGYTPSAQSTLSDFEFRETFDQGGLSTSLPEKVLNTYKLDRDDYQVEVRIYEYEKIKISSPDLSIPSEAGEFVQTDPTLGIGLHQTGSSVISSLMGSKKMEP